MIGERLDFKLQPVGNGDRDWVADQMIANWGSKRVVTRGVMHDATWLPGFIAVSDGRRVGLVTFRMAGDDCEMVTLHSLVRGKGIGTALIEAVRRWAEHEGAARLWLITTNDNLPAQEFFRNRGFVVKEIHKGAIEVSRRLKPEIPLRGVDGVAITDEIEMEIPLV